LDLSFYGTLAVFLASTALLLSKRVRYDVVGISSLVALILLGAVSPERALVNLASPAVVVLACLLAISRSLEKSGFLENFGELITSRVKDERVVLATLLLSAGLLSGFVSDVALTALLIPAFVYAAKKFGKAPSKYLIPLSFASILGGRYTVIGTTPNVVLDQLWFQSHGVFLPFFQFAPVGLTSVLLGLGSMALILRLLPSNPSAAAGIEGFKTSDYLVEGRIEEGELVGKTVRYLEKMGVKVLDVQPRRVSFGPRVLEKGDTVIMQVNPDSLPTLSALKGLRLAPSSSEAVKGGDLYEVLVPSGSEAVGKTLADLDLDLFYGVKVLGISGKAVRGRISRISLNPGDTLLVQGEEEGVGKMMEALGLVPLYQRRIKLFNPRMGLTSLASLILGTVLSSLGLNIAESFLVAVIPVVVTNYREVYRNMEWPLLVFVGTYISLGQALASTGLMTHIPLVSNPVILFAVTALIANLVNNAAAAVIMGPVALSTPNPLASITVVAMASSSTFLTPFSHQANLLVTEAGKYGVKDFLIAGSIVLALIALSTLTFVALVH
jgi:di/tricarboxylate transporter